MRAAEEKEDIEIVGKRLRIACGLQKEAKNLDQNFLLVTILVSSFFFIFSFFSYFYNIIYFYQIFLSNFLNTSCF